MIFRIAISFLTLLLCVSLLNAQTKIPLKDKNSYLRLELNGVPDKIMLKITPPSNATLYKAGWYGEDAPYVSVIDVKDAQTEKWSDFTLTFTPNRSGKIWLRIGGRWTKYGEERNWLLVTGVKLNGKPVQNGEFKEYREKSPEVYRPKNWILHHRAEYYLDVGENKSPACLINHDSPITTSFQVRAGEPNTITIRTKLPPRRLIPKFVPPKKVNPKSTFY